jgi:hypothetical protein
LLLLGGSVAGVVGDVGDEEDEEGGEDGCVTLRQFNPFLPFSIKLLFVRTNPITPPKPL